MAQYPDFALDIGDFISAGIKIQHLYGDHLPRLLVDTVALYHLFRLDSRRALECNAAVYPTPCTLPQTTPSLRNEISIRTDIIPNCVRLLTDPFQ